MPLLAMMKVSSPAKKKPNKKKLKVTVIKMEILFFLPNKTV